MRNVSKSWWTMVAATGVFALTCGASVTLETVWAEAKPAAAKMAKTAKTDVKVAAGDAVKRGQYLVTTLACNDCHTPFKMGPKGPEPDMTRMLSGHPAAQKISPPPRFNADWQWAGIGGMTAFAGPWGVSFTANLTPDKETGLGNWTEEMFTSAIRTGKHAGVGRAILPPMPWPWYGKMTDADLKAIFAYLQTIKPIKNAVPSPVPPSGAPAATDTRE